tara:strand:+ start:53 stop:169 length:117 start_codon:yes stop_codon:yes gene_type:complete
MSIPLVIPTKQAGFKRTEAMKENEGDKLFRSLLTKQII